MQVEAAVAVLEDYLEDIPSAQLANGETHFGRIGPAKVIVARSRAGFSRVTGKNLVATLPESDALVFTSCVAEESLGANPGDILIGSPVSNSEVPVNILQRAINVLNREVGDEGYWLLPNLPQEASIVAVQRSTKAANSRQRDITNAPRLHYLQDNKTSIPFLDWDRSEKAPRSRFQSFQFLTLM
jgi:hypothetical protein